MRRTTEEHFASHWLANRGFALVSLSSAMFLLLAVDVSPFKRTSPAPLDHRAAHLRGFAIASSDICCLIFGLVFGLFMACRIYCPCRTCRTCSCARRYLTKTIRPSRKYTLSPVPSFLMQ